MSLMVIEEMWKGGGNIVWSVFPSPFILLPVDVSLWEELPFFVCSSGVLFVAMVSECFFVPISEYCGSGRNFGADRGPDFLRVAWSTFWGVDRSFVSEDPMASLIDRI